MRKSAQQDHADEKQDDRGQDEPRFPIGGGYEIRAGFVGGDTKVLAQAVNRPRRTTRQNVHNRSGVVLSSRALVAGELFVGELVAEVKRPVFALFDALVIGEKVGGLPGLL